MVRKVLKIILVISFMSVIFAFSMDSGDASSKKSHSIVFTISEFFLRRELTEQEKETYVLKYNKPLRKCAHFSIYFLLGLSFASLLKEYSVSSKNILFWTIFFVFFYACSDEIHQLFVESRSGEILDVFLDTFGGSCASYFYTLIRRNFHEQEKTTC